MASVGLLEPVIFNRVTGNVLGGHQRLASLDALEGHGNYLLDVAVVQLSATSEAEQNIALNNPEMQGEWDLELLGDLLRTHGLELENTGFDFADVQVMFDDPSIASMFAPNTETEELLAATVEQQQLAREEQKAATQARREEVSAHGGEKRDTEVYAIVLFQNREGREAFMAACETDPEDRYVDGARLLERLSANLPAS